MLRTALALFVSMSVSAPAFAQQPENKVWDSIGKIKEYITAYDSGNGTLLAKVGGKTLLYSFAGLGAAHVALSAPTTINWYNPLSYQGYFRVGQSTAAGRVAAKVKDVVGIGGVGIGMGLVGASAITFLAQHVWYGWLGHADQNAALTAEHQEWTNYFATKSQQEIFADAQNNAELSERLVQLAGAIHQVK